MARGCGRVRFAAQRLSVAVGSLQPQLLAHAALVAALTAYEQWLADEHADLSQLLRVAFKMLDDGFGHF